MIAWLSFCFIKSNGHFAPHVLLRPYSRWLPWSYRGLPALLGFVLLAAAVLKAHRLATGANADIVLSTSLWLVIGMIEFELVLGLALLLAIYPRQAMLVALVSFTTFAVVSLQRAIAGRVSCCCFGMIPVRPWLTFLFDVVAVAAIWSWHPEPNIFSNGGYEPAFLGVSFP